ncbi:uncharacterized protein [Prorops nasuta]|uniref:uncharacterized protein n=1 Tax=Prorops nasuta TaxID=863751 RepID=UPI0034CDFE74
MNECECEDVLREGQFMIGRHKYTIKKSLFFRRRSRSALLASSDGHFLYFIVCSKKLFNSIIIYIIHTVRTQKKNKMEFPKWTIIFAVLLTIYLKEVNSQTSNSEEKQGVCPPLLPVQICSRSCFSDFHCQGPGKCCPTSCGGFVCSRPVSARKPQQPAENPGSCPAYPTGPWVCSSTCTVDSDCKGIKKCCRNRCGAFTCQNSESDVINSVDDSTEPQPVKPIDAIPENPNPNEGIPGNLNPNDRIPVTPSLNEGIPINPSPNERIPENRNSFDRGVPENPGNTYDRLPVTPNLYDRAPGNPNVYDRFPVTPNPYGRFPENPNPYDRVPLRSNPYDRIPINSNPYDRFPLNPNPYYDRIPVNSNPYDRIPVHRSPYDLEFNPGFNPYPYNPYENPGPYRVNPIIPDFI